VQVPIMRANRQTSTNKPNGKIIFYDFVARGNGKN
jgi:hypothetical protein